MPNPGLARLSENKYNGTVREIAQEKAASLGRSGRRLERSLALLRSAPPDDPNRDSLVNDAAEALYFYVVQREACGLIDTASVYLEMDVPREVQLRMGIRPSSRTF